MQKLTEDQLLQQWQALNTRRLAPEEPTLMARTRPQIRTLKLKQDSAKLFAAGISIKDVANKCNVSAYTVRQYYSKWCIDQDVAAHGHRTDQLRSEAQGLAAQRWSSYRIAQYLGISDAWVRLLLKP